MLGGDLVLGKQLRVRVDEGPDHPVAPSSGREVEGGSTEAISGHEVLDVLVVDLWAADKRAKQLVI